MSYKKPKNIQAVADPPLPNINYTSNTSRKAPKLAPNQHLIGAEIDVNRYIQFRFHGLGSNDMVHECICKQDNDLRHALDKFFKDSFGCPVHEFKRL